MTFRPSCLAWRWLPALSLALAVGLGPAAARVSPGAETAASARAVSGQSGIRTFPPTLRVGVLADGWPPFDVFSGDQLTGFSVAYLRLLVGPDVQLVPTRFADMPRLLAAACAGQVDLVMSVARTAERERCLAFTTPYLRGTVAFVTRTGDTAALASSASAGRPRIATEKGFALEASLRKRFAAAPVRLYATTPEALHAVEAGAADVYAGFTPVVRYELASGRYRGLRVAYEERMQVRDLRFAVPHSKAALRDRLDAALERVTPGASAALRARWLDGDPLASQLVLSDQERAWLRALPPLAVGFDDDWAPFSFVGPSGRPAGIANDTLDYLERSLGVRFRRVLSPNWPDTATAFGRGGGDLALLAASSYDDPQLGTALPTQPYEHYPFVLVARNDEPVARDLADFAGRTVALAPHAPSSSSGPWFAALTGTQMVRVSSVAAGLNMVDSRRADVLVVDVAAVAGMLERYSGLRIVGAAGHDDRVSFAVRADLAPLAGLIDRALRAMPAVESQRIRDRWVSADTGGHRRWSVNAVRLLPLLIVFGVALVVTLRAYTLLLREVRRRRRAECVLARQIELQTTMMEMIPYPFAARDLQNRYIAVNHAFEEASGLARVDVLGRPGISVMPWGEEHSRRVDDMYWAAIAGQGTQRVELELRDPRGGEPRYGIFWTRLCHDGRDRPLCVLGAMIDITEIRRAELRARETERLLSDVTRWLPALVFLLRRTRDGRYLFPYIGGDLQRLRGHDDRGADRGDGEESAAIETPGLARVHRGDRRRLIARLERSARQLTPVHVAFRYRAPAGQMWVRAEFVPRPDDDGAVVWSGCAFDASIDHARAEELARARDMAQAASRAKDRFLAMMSHEIRTPMNGVLGLIEVLERTPLNVQQSEMVGMVQESASALLQILDDLLDFAKIEAGRLAIEVAPFDVRELVDRAVGLLAARAHEKGLALCVEVEPNVAAMLRGDSVRLRQILFNLLGNAIKFTREGEVRVLVTASDVDGADGGARQRLSLSVEDTGVGIEPEVQKQLFEPFVQAESSTTRRFGGTGLGLAICRRLAELMGGRLTLRSEPGLGTCMTLSIELDVHAASVTPSDSAPAIAPARGDAMPAAPDREAALAAGRLILVAEDHPVNQELMRHQLALLGFACDVANDGEAARTALERTRYGCLLTDCHMPRLSGYDLVRWWRERERERGHRRLPVIGITASTSSDDRRLCRESGMDDCLVKPLRLATLREHLLRRFGAEVDAASDKAIATGEARRTEPLDLDRLIQVWGSAATVKALLGSFVASVRDDLRALLQLLDECNVQRLRDWHHRLAGAVGVLHYPAFLAVLQTYRDNLDRYDADQLRTQGLELIAICNAMLDGVEQQVGSLL